MVNNVLVSVAVVSTCRQGHFLIKLLGSTDTKRPTREQTVCTDHNTQEAKHSFDQTEGEVEKKPDCTVCVSGAICSCLIVQTKTSF